MARKTIGDPRNLSQISNEVLLRKGLKSSIKPVVKKSFSYMLPIVKRHPNRYDTDFENRSISKENNPYGQNKGEYEYFKSKLNINSDNMIKKNLQRLNYNDTGLKLFLNKNIKDI